MTVEILLSSPLVSVTLYVNVPPSPVNPAFAVNVPVSLAPSWANEPFTSISSTL